MKSNFINRFQREATDGGDSGVLSPKEAYNKLYTYISTDSSIQDGRAGTYLALLSMLQITIGSGQQKIVKLTPEEKGNDSQHLPLSLEQHNWNRLYELSAALSTYPYMDHKRDEMVNEQQSLLAYFNPNKI